MIYIVRHKGLHGLVEEKWFSTREEAYAFKARFEGQFLEIIPKKGLTIRQPQSILKTIGDEHEAFRRFTTERKQHETGNTDANAQRREMETCH